MERSQLPKCECGNTVGLMVLGESVWCHQCITNRITELETALGPQPIITQQAARDLLAACEIADGSVMPYRGDQPSPERTYTVSRAAVKGIRAAIANVKGTA